MLADGGGPKLFEIGDASDITDGPGDPRALVFGREQLDSLVNGALGASADDHRAPSRQEGVSEAEADAAGAARDDDGAH